MGFPGRRGLFPFCRLFVVSLSFWFLGCSPNIVETLSQLCRGAGKLCRIFSKLCRKLCRGSVVGFPNFVVFSANIVGSRVLHSQNFVVCLSKLCRWGAGPCIQICQTLSFFLSLTLSQHCRLTRPTLSSAPFNIVETLSFFCRLVCGMGFADLQNIVVFLSSSFPNFVAALAQHCRKPLFAFSKHCRFFVVDFNAFFAFSKHCRFFVVQFFVC